MQCSSLLAVYSNYSSINRPAKAKSSSVCELIWGGREWVGVEISGVQGWGGGIIVGRCQITWTTAAVHILSAAKSASESKTQRCDVRGEEVWPLGGEGHRRSCSGSSPEARVQSVSGSIAISNVCVFSQTIYTLLREKSRHAGDGTQMTYRLCLIID